MAKRHWGDSRQILTPSDQNVVLHGLAARMLAEEAWDPVPDWEIVRTEIADEIEQQSSRILAEAQADYDDYEKRRTLAKHEYGRADYFVCAILGVLAGYLLCVFLLPEYLSLAQRLPGHGLTPLIIGVLGVAFAVRWRIWRRQRSAAICAVSEAYQHWEYVLRTQVLRPFVIERLNVEARNPRLFDTSLSQKAPLRLIEGTEPKRLVTTQAMDQIGATARDIHSGSLGVSGPRGVGKSTIVNFFCDNEYADEVSENAARVDGTESAGSSGSKDLRLLVSAPVDYEPREFIVHLFTELCEAVSRGAADDSSMAVQTRRHLENLKNLRTSSNSWSASFTLKSFLGIGGTRAEQLAEQPVTLPELVAKYRQYSGKVAMQLRSERGDDARVVIGIDEVDKILDGERAESFLNDIKAVFGVPGCLYLVSLSEDAMAIFARRALSIRTAFDSAFDEIVAVGPMTYWHSEQLLFKRVTGVPRPFLALCHVLAGGLPRDLVRMARALVDGAPVTGEKTLHEIASALVQGELASLRQASLNRLADRADATALLRTLYGSDWPGTTPRELARLASHLVAVVREAESEVLSQACRELVVSLSFYTTVLTVFGPSRHRLVSQLREGRYDLIDDLAAARHSMRLNVGLAHSLLEKYRQENRICLEHVGG